MKGLAMQWIEVINLRTTAHDPRQLTDRYLKPVAREAEKKGDVNVKIYRHPMFSTDLSVHIHRKNGATTDYKTGLGHRIARLLEPFGLIHYSVWMEV